MKINLTIEMTSSMIVIVKAVVNSLMNLNVINAVADFAANVFKRMKNLHYCLNCGDDVV